MDQDRFEDINHVERVLGEVFPELKCIAPLRRLGRGATSVVIETSSGIVFRLGKNAAAMASYEREGQLLPLLHPHIDLPIPEPAWHSSRSPRAPFGVMGYLKFQGEPIHPRKIMEMNWRRIAGEVAQFLYQLHLCSHSDFAKLDLPAFSSEPEALTALWPQVSRFSELVFTKDEYEVVCQWWDQMLTDERMQGYDSVIIHGDPFYANVLVDWASSSVTGILDFENCTLGDPAYDLTVQFRLGQEFGEAVVKAYTDAGGRFDSSFTHRMHHLRILRGFVGLAFFSEYNDVTDFAYQVWKIRNGPLFQDA